MCEQRRYSPPRLIIKPYAVELGELCHRRPVYAFEVALGLDRAWVDGATNGISRPQAPHRSPPGWSVIWVRWTREPMARGTLRGEHDS
jgi:hypothetical protein